MVMEEAKPFSWKREFFETWCEQCMDCSTCHFRNKYICTTEFTNSDKEERAFYIALKSVGFKTFYPKGKES